MGQQGLPPGYRFSPTDEELVVHYLKNRACGKGFHQGVITEVDIYKYEPWDLPEKSALPSLDPVWYFFNAQDKRHSHTARINRTTSKGYWKATGKDRKICCGPHIVGIKKTLIYYEGRAPSGKRTDWIMHEYKLDEEFEKKSKVQSSVALCRIRRKGGPGPRNGEQYGASVFHDNNEWGEDVEEDVDEKLPILPDSKCEVSVAIMPSQIKKPMVQGEVVSNEGCASNDLPIPEGLDTKAELDLQAFLESVFTNDAEVTSGPVLPYPGLDKPIAGHQPFDYGTNADLYSLLDIQSLFEVDDKIVENIMHPTVGEEQMLEEMLHLMDGGPLHGGNVEGNGRIIPQPPACSDGNMVYNDDILFGDELGVSRVPGDFIELDDMNSPLEGFVMQLPRQGGYYSAQEDEDRLFALLDGVDYGGPSDLLHTQGSAARRARLQIALPSGSKGMHAKIQKQIVTHPKVQCGENFSDRYIQNVGGNSSQNIAVSSSDSEEICSVVKSLPKTFLSKHMSHCMVTKCEEVSPQVFVTMSDDEFSMNDSKSDVPVSSRPQDTSSVIEESSPDCEAGLESRSLLSSKHLNKYSCMQDAGVDCEAGVSSIGVTKVVSSHAVAASPHGISVISELVSKVKSLRLGGGLAQLDSNLSTTFNNRVFALGKPVAQLVPSTNPYCSLRRGAMVSLFQLVIAVVFLFFLFLGIHMLTKYVLSAAART